MNDLKQFKETITGLGSTVSALKTAVLHLNDAKATTQSQIELSQHLEDVQGRLNQVTPQTTSVSDSFAQYSQHFEKISELNDALAAMADQQSKLIEAIVLIATRVEAENFVDLVTDVNDILN